MSPSTQRYVLAMRVLHWTIAVVVIGSLAAGIYVHQEFAAGRFGSWPAPVAVAAWAHKSVGFVILALMAARVVLRSAFGSPDGGLDIPMLVLALAAIAVWAAPLIAPAAPGGDVIEVTLNRMVLLDEVRLGAIAVAAVAGLGVLASLARRRPAQALARPLPFVMRLGADLAHGALYVLLFAMALVGWAATSAGKFLEPFWGDVRPPELFDGPGDIELYGQIMQLHGLIGYAIVGVLTLHILAALFHGVVRRDGVLSRMGF